MSLIVPYVVISKRSIELPSQYWMGDGDEDVNYLMGRSCGDHRKDMSVCMHVCLSLGEITAAPSDVTLTSTEAPSFHQTNLTGTFPSPPGRRTSYPSPGWAGGGTGRDDNIYDTIPRYQSACKTFSGLIKWQSCEIGAAN